MGADEVMPRLELRPGLCGDWLANNRLSHDTAETTFSCSSIGRHVLVFTGTFQAKFRKYQ
jgi:hypothetical protein